MLQVIGLIIAVYTLIRLMQIPIEHGKDEKKSRTLAVLSWIGIILIGLLTLDLVLSSGPTMPSL